MAKDYVFDALGHITGEQELIDMFRAINDAQNTYLSDNLKAMTPEEKREALSKRNQAYAAIGFDAYTAAQDRRSQHLAKKLNIAQTLVEPEPDLTQDFKLDMAYLYLAGAIKFEYTIGNEKFFLGATALLNNNLTNIAGMAMPENRTPAIQAQGLVFVRFQLENVLIEDFWYTKYLIEINTGVTSGYHESKNGGGYSPYTAFSIGLAFGKRFKIGQQIVLEFYAGLGLNISNSEAYPVGYPRVGICLGKRFNYV